MSSEIEKLVREGENERVEFCGARTHTKTLARSICGMLNQQGGMIVLGVSDDGIVAGVRDADHDVEELHAFVADHISPISLVSIACHEIGDRDVVVIDVPQGADKPYSFDREIFVRVGRQTLKAGAEQSTSIVQKSVSQFDRWEFEPLPGFEITDCDASELADAQTEIIDVGRLGGTVPEDSLDFLRRLHLNRSGQLTNAAAVLFAVDPLNWSPNIAIRIVSFAEDKMSDISNDTLIHGPAVQSLRNAVSTIQQRTGYSGRFERSELNRKDVPAYPLYALREGLVNAIVHRDYTIVGGQIRIEIYKDRLTIQNPGHLPDGWKPVDLKRKHGSVPFNPDIARVFYLRKLMEQLGIGTQKVIAECKKLKAPQPQWDDSQNMVTLTLFPAPEPTLQVSLSERQQLFLGSSKAGHSYKSSEYARITGVVERQARRELAELIEFGYFERTGRGPSTVYVRTEKP